MLLALPTSHKIGLIAMAAVFVGFAIMSAVVIPRFRPSWPGRGLPYFILASVALFAGMITSVIVFGREGGEAKASEAKKPAQTSGGAAAAQKVSVTESEFKIVLPKTALAAGSYVFDVNNAGKLPHDLTINGPGVSNEKTPVFGPGKSETLNVTLKSGTYDFYCSVPGHKQAGMDVKVTVS